MKWKHEIGGGLYAESGRCRYAIYVSDGGYDIYFAEKGQLAKTQWHFSQTTPTHSYAKREAIILASKDRIKELTQQLADTQRGLQRVKDELARLTECSRPEIVALPSSDPETYIKEVVTPEKAFPPSASIRGG